MVRLPRLPPNFDAMPDRDKLLQRYWQQMAEALEEALNSILAIPEIQAALEVLDTTIEAANVAIANVDAATAATTAASSLANSGTSGLTITATDAGASVTITISAHTRTYGDGTSVAVSGASLTGLSYSTSYYLFYDDPTRAGGAVTIQSSTDPDDTLQIGNRHSLGGVSTPAAAAPPEDGVSWLGPGGIYL